MSHTHDSSGECTNASVIGGTELQILSNLIDATGFYIVTIAPKITEEQREAMFAFKGEVVDAAIRHGLTTFQVAESVLGLLAGSLERAEIVDNGVKIDETLN